MPTAETTGHLPEVAPPAHPLYELTTYELRDYRHQLEHAITFFSARTRSRPSAPTCRPGWMK